MEDSTLFEAELRAKYKSNIHKGEVVSIMDRVPKRPGPQWGLVSPMSGKTVTKEMIEPKKKPKRDYSHLQNKPHHQKVKEFKESFD